MNEWMNDMRKRRGMMGKRRVRVGEGGKRREQAEANLIQPKMSHQMEDWTEKKRK